MQSYFLQYLCSGSRIVKLIAALCSHSSKNLIFPDKIMHFSYTKGQPRPGTSRDSQPGTSQQPPAESAVPSDTTPTSTSQLPMTEIQIDEVFPPSLRTSPARTSLTTRRRPRRIRLRGTEDTGEPGEMEAGVQNTRISGIHSFTPLNPIVSTQTVTAAHDL